MTTWEHPIAGTPSPGAVPVADGPQEGEVREALLALLGRVHTAPDAGAAMLELLDFALARRGALRALALVERDGCLLGVAGRGWDDDHVGRIILRAEEIPAALSHVLRAGQATLLSDLPGPAGMAACQAVPLPAPDGDAFGVVLLEGVSATGLPETALAARHAGPALFHRLHAQSLQRAVTHLDRQRLLFVALLDALPDPVLITDAGHAILLENQRAATLFQVEGGDTKERRRMVGINNLLLSSSLARNAVAGTGRNGPRELALVEPGSGADLLFETLSTPLAADLAGEGATLSVLRDVTALRRASTQLEHQIRRVRQAEVRSRRERDRLNLILENVGDPILVSDEEGRVILLNRAAEGLFAAAVEPGRETPTDRAEGENDARFHAFVAAFMTSPEPTRVAEMPLVQPETGAEFPAEVVSGKILSDAGEVTATVSVIHDLTKAAENERLAAELGRLNEGLEDRVRTATAALEERNRQLEWQSRELKRAYRLKSEFLASMSHELRTPINALLGYSSLMRDRIYGELTERQEGALDRMSSASRHLLDLVNDILDLARIEAGKMPVHVGPVDVGELMAELAGTLEPMVGERSLTLEVEVAPDLPVVHTDGTRVRQVLLNLLSNAVKFTREGGVRMTARPVRAGVEVEVADTGIGIPPDDLEGIFDDFRQVDQSSTREFGGTGLGLSITRKLLELLGGTIRVRSRLGEGSVFTVWFPPTSQPVVVPDVQGTEPDGL